MESDRIVAHENVQFSNGNYESIQLITRRVNVVIAGSRHRHLRGPEIAI